AARLLRLLGRLLRGLGGLALGAAALHLLHRGAVVVEAELPGPPAEGHHHQPRGAFAHRAALLDLVEAADALGQREGQIAGGGRVGIVAVPALTADEALAGLPRLDDPQHVGRAVGLLSARLLAGDAGAEDPVEVHARPDLTRELAPGVLVVVGAGVIAELV